MKMFCYCHQHFTECFSYSKWQTSGTGARGQVIFRMFLFHCWIWRRSDRRGEHVGKKTLRNMSVWRDAAAAVSPTLDFSQAESRFFFQKRSSNYLLVKVTFLSMALEISLVLFVIFISLSCRMNTMFIVLPFVPFIFHWQVITWWFSQNMQL